MARLVLLGASTIYGHRGYEDGQGGVGELIKAASHTAAPSDPLSRITEVHVRARPTQTVNEMIGVYQHFSEEFALVRGRNIIYAQLGGYDPVIPNGQTESALSIVQFTSYASQLIEQVKKDDLERGTPLILGTAAGIDDEQAEKYYQETGERFSNAGRVACNQVTLALAEHYGVPVVDNYRLLGGDQIHSRGYLARDRVHPNGRGHLLMAQRLMRTVRHILRQPNPLYSS